MTVKRKHIRLNRILHYIFKFCITNVKKYLRLCNLVSTSLYGIIWWIHKKEEVTESESLMKKIVKTLLIISIIFSVVWGGLPVKASANQDLDVKINVGFNGAYKIGFSTPVNVNIKNNLKDINGQVEIRVPSSPGKYMSYDKPVSLQKGSEKLITINVPISNDNRNKYVVNIYDGNEKVYEDTITTIASNNVTTFIGILSDDFDSLSYINTAPASPGVTTLTKTIKLDEKNFPEDIFTLKAFNILVINDFDTSRFSKSQYEVLKLWVKNGGTLVIGTGSKYNKTLSLFKDDFIQGTQGSVKEISTTKIYELATNGDNKNETKLDFLQVKVKDAAAVLEDSGNVLVHALKKGRGVVGLLAFDLGKAPFSNWSNNTEFIEKVFGLVNPELIAGSNTYSINNYFTNNPYAMQEAVQQFSEMAAVKTSVYYLILFIYILVAAPLSYFILKRLDKREWMWLTVPVMAVVFAALVYVSGSGTRLGKISTNMISYITLDNSGNASTDTYVGILNTNKSRVKISGKNGERLLPLYNYYYSNQPSGKEVLEATIHSGENGAVEYKNSSILENKILQLQENEVNLGKLETDLNITNGRITGTIKNTTNLDMQDCLLIMPDGYYKIENLKKGQVVNLDSSKILSHNGNIFQMIQDSYFNRTNSSKSEEQRKRNLDLRQEGNILQRLFDFGNAQVEGIKFVGFSKTEIHNQLLVNGEPARKLERNVLIIPVDVKFTNNGEIEYPLGFVPYDVSNSAGLNYDMNTKRFFGNGSSEILYRLDTNMIVNEIQISVSAIQFKSPNNKSGYSIFNLKENKYEPLNDILISEDKIKDYLSPENTVKIKLEVTDGEIGVPAMAAKGRKK